MSVGLFQLDNLSGKHRSKPPAIAAMDSNQIWTIVAKKDDAGSLGV